MKPDLSSLLPTEAVEARPPTPGYAPLRAMHAFLSDAPAGLDVERRDVYAFTNWCMVLAFSTHSVYLVLFAVYVQIEKCHDLKGKLDGWNERIHLIYQNDDKNKSDLR